MSAHVVLLVVAVVLLVIAGLLEFPWNSTWPRTSLSHSLGWLGAAAGFASMWL
jgi:hypothetical protein